jgi:hypothetical protein
MPTPVASRSQRLPNPIGWRDQLGEGFRAIERRWLEAMLGGAARVSARSNDDSHEYIRHLRNVGTMIANAETLCVINHEDARLMRQAWVRREAELCLYTLAPEERRALLLDPTDGPQRFLTLKRRTQMLREIDGTIPWITGKRVSPL